MSVVSLSTIQPTPVTFWTGSNHGASIVKLEPLELTIVTFRPWREVCETPQEIFGQNGFAGSSVCALGEEGFGERNGIDFEGARKHPAHHQSVHAQNPTCDSNGDRIRRALKFPGGRAWRNRPPLPPDCGGSVSRSDSNRRRPKGEPRIDSPGVRPLFVVWDNFLRLSEQRRGALFVDS